MSLVCPRCGLALVRRDVPAGALHGCNHCGGVWVTHDVVQRVNAALCEGTLASADALTRSTATAPAAGPARCPVCGVSLTPWLVPRANVEIDHDDHGAWFDRDELRRVAQSVAASRAYGGSAAAAGAAAVGVAGAAAATAAADPTLVHRAQRAVDAHGETVLDVASTGLEFVDAESVVAGAEVAAEVGGGLASGAFELLGSILGAIDF